MFNDFNSPIDDVTAVYIQFEGEPALKKRQNAVIRFDFKKDSVLHNVIRSQSDGDLTVDMNFFIFDKVETRLETLARGNSDIYLSGFGERGHDFNNDGLMDWSTEVQFVSGTEGLSDLIMTLKMNGNDSTAKRRIKLNLDKCEAI